MSDTPTLSRRPPTAQKSRELLVFRHGKSDWTTDAPTDFERPLARRGRKAVKQMGRWMQAQGLGADCILSSPATRAEQTARRLCRFAQLPESRIQWVSDIYEAGVGTLLRVLAKCPQRPTTVMIVGHNPGLEELVRYLAGDADFGPARDNPMPTAALARLRMPQSWEKLGPGCAELIGIQRPRELE